MFHFYIINHLYSKHSSGAFNSMMLDSSNVKECQRYSALHFSGKVLTPDQWNFMEGFTSITFVLSEFFMIYAGTIIVQWLESWYDYFFFLSLEQPVGTGSYSTEEEEDYYDPNNPISPESRLEGSKWLLLFQACCIFSVIAFASYLTKSG